MVMPLCTLMILQNQNVVCRHWLFRFVCFTHMHHFTNLNAVDFCVYKSFVFPNFTCQNLLHTDALIFTCAWILLPHRAICMLEHETYIDIVCNTIDTGMPSSAMQCEQLFCIYTTCLHLLYRPTTSQYSWIKSHSWNWPFNNDKWLFCTEIKE